MDQNPGWAEIELLYRREYGKFVRVAQAVVGDRETAREAVQEAFADALRHASEWAGRGPLEAWVWRCVVNRARKAVPRKRPLLAGETNGHGDGADPDLRARLAALPERQRLVVFLRYFADLGYREIATALDIEVGTVSATLNAAHRTLRAELEEVPA